MPEVVACPSCQRQLSVPESLLGQLVRCPACQTTFTAEAGAPPAPPPPPREDRPPEREFRRADDDYDRDRDRDRPPRRRYEDEDDYDRGPRRRRYEDEDDYDRGYARPHRGGAVLTLGILSICIFCIPLVAWILGGIAIGMANTDLKEMAMRRMDRSGQGQTQAGKTCGIIGVVLGSCWALTACLIRAGGGFR